MFIKVKEKNSGFTILELIISTAIIVMMMIFVLANYRTAGTSGEINSSLQMILNGFSTAQAKGVSGNLVEDPLSPPNKIYPDEGYAIYFEEDTPSEFLIYGLHQELRLDEEIFTLPVAEVVDLCGLPSGIAPTVPCVTADGWDSTVASAEVTFDLSGKVSANIKDADEPANDLFGFDYVGGVIEHQKTGQRAYFIISLISGIASGDRL